MTQYLIKKSVYFCYSGSQVVFLDLKRNKYSAIDRRQATVLNGVVAGWNASESNTECVEDTIKGKYVRKVVTEGLLQLGILTESREHGKKAAPTRVDRPSADLMEEYESSAPSVRFLHVIRFLKAYLYAAISLRVSSLARIADRIAARKKLVGRQAQSRSIAETRELFLIYVRLRPFLFRASDKCLLDSLVLVDFLRYYDIYPTWVIGVSSDPFVAHSWLEMDEVVINDRTLRVNLYSPIMAQ